jgi:hypothetical protein
LLHLAATYQRTADQLAPQPPASLKFFAWAFGVDLKTMMQGMERLSGHHVLRLK